MTIGLISAGCIFGGALLGLLLQGLLPEHHLRDTSKDTVKVAAGMIATLSALVLGLLVASAKSSFDATNTAMTQNGAKLCSWIACLRPMARRPKMLASSYAAPLPPGSRCSGLRKRTWDRE